MNTPKSLQRVTNWTRPQTLAAFHIYTQLPFGQLHRHTPKIKQLAEWIGRTPGAVALKLVNLASLDPAIVARGLHGMVNASALDRAIWNELHNSWDTVALEAVAEYEKLAKSHGVVADEDLLNDAPVFDVGNPSVCQSDSSRTLDFWNTITVGLVLRPRALFASI